MAEDGGGAPSGALPDLVAQCYYRYGLLVATHPKKVIFLAFTSFLILWQVLFSPSNSSRFIYVDNNILNSFVHLMSVLVVKKKWYVQPHQLVLHAAFLPSSTPLWHLPLPGYLPQEYATSLFNYSVPPPAPEGGIRLDPSPTPAPLWYQGPPLAYILQVRKILDCG